MEFPLNVTIGLFEMSSHLVFETLAFLVGFRYYLYLRKKETDLLSSSERLWILVSVCIGALFFSRFIAVMEHINMINANTPLLFYYSQKTIVGGLLGGLIAVEITKKILKIKTSSGDIMTYPLIIGIMIGRIGCFLAGLEDGTYGVETDLIWGVDLGDKIKRHPTQIYEILFLLFLGVYIRALENRNLIAKLRRLKIFQFNESDSLPNGLKFKLFLSFYLAFRFFVEFIKPVNTFYVGLSFIQISCLCGIIYYLLMLFKKTKKC